MNWKKLLLTGIGWGLGTAVGLALIVGGFLWYENRPKPPKPPKPWDTASIRAEYDDVDTEGDKNTIVFYYTLENTTAFDYQIEDGTKVTMNAKLLKQNSLSPFGDWQRVDYPIFVPAKKRVRFKIHIEYPYPAKDGDGTVHRTAVAKYVVDNLNNLDGFDLLDETNRYEIVFPSGWKKK